MFRSCLIKSRGIDVAVILQFYELCIITIGLWLIARIKFRRSKRRMEKSTIERREVHLRPDDSTDTSFSVDKIACGGRGSRPNALFSPSQLNFFAGFMKRGHSSRHYLYGRRELLVPRWFKSLHSTVAPCFICIQNALRDGHPRHSLPLSFQRARLQTARDCIRVDSGAYHYRGKNI